MHHLDICSTLITTVQAELTSDVIFHSPTEFSMSLGFCRFCVHRSICGVLSHRILYNPSYVHIGLSRFSVFSFSFSVQFNFQSRFSCLKYEQLMFGTYGVVPNAFLNCTHKLAHMVMKLDGCVT